MAKIFLEKMFAAKKLLQFMELSKFYLNISIVISLVFLPICCAEARTPLEIPLEEMKDSQEVETSAELSKNPDACNQKNVALQAVMDRVCELCHDMYSHTVANMRAQCRADCFKTEQFKKCLRLFKPSRSKQHMRWNSGFRDFLLQL